MAGEAPLIGRGIGADGATSGCLEAAVPKSTIADARLSITRRSNVSIVSPPTNCAGSEWRLDHCGDLLRLPLGIREKKLADPELLLPVIAVRPVKWNWRKIFSWARPWN